MKGDAIKKKDGMERRKEDEIKENEWSQGVAWLGHVDIQLFCPTSKTKRRG